MSGEAVIHLTKPGDRESNKNKPQLHNMQQKICPERKWFIWLSQVNARATKAKRNAIIWTKDMSGETMIHVTEPGERESIKSKAQLHNMQQKICPERQWFIS